MAYDPSLGYDPANIAKSINEAAARGDDAEVERLSVERYKKIQADPNLMKQYGTDAYSQVAQNVLRRTAAIPTQAPVTQQQPAQPQQTQSFADMMSWMDAMSAAQKASAVAGVERARSSALSDLQAERSTITPQYLAQRQAVASEGALQQQRMDEAMAQRGLGASGAAGALQGRIMGTTQTGINTANIQEQAALDDILRRQNQVEAEYQYALQSATSAAEAQAIQNKIDQVRSDRQYALQQAAYTGMLDGQQTLQGQAAAREAAQFQQDQAAAALQGQIDTIGQYGADYQAEINRRQATADTSDDALVPYLSIARQAKIAAQNSAASEAASTQYANAMNMFKNLGYASGWVAQALGLPEGAKTVDYEEMLYAVNKPYYNPNTGGSSGSSNNFSQLMQVWKATGSAPAGLESYGVTQGTPYGTENVKQIGLTGANKEITDILKVGGSYDEDNVLVSSNTAEQAYNRLVEMVDSGLISEGDADTILANNPALNQYATSLAGMAVYQGGR